MELAGGPTRLGQIVFGEATRKATAAAWAWRNRKCIPAEYAPDIERGLAGAITVDEIRPDVHWTRVPDPAWPHKGGRPCIDVAARRAA